MLTDRRDRFSLSGPRVIRIRWLSARLPIRVSLPWLPRDYVRQKIKNGRTIPRGTARCRRRYTWNDRKSESVVVAYIIETAKSAVAGQVYWALGVRGLNSTLTGNSPFRRDRFRRYYRVVISWNRKADGTTREYIRRWSTQLVKRLLMPEISARLSFTIEILFENAICVSWATTITT